jgi:acyl-CoA synthetase (AMP-forming)/AMP-acid ligase II
MAGEQLVATEMVLMAQAIDDLAVSDPERVICKVPTGPNVRNGFYELTVRDIACAVDHMAWWIDKSLGCSSAPETLAYIGMNDIRYLVVILACNKTGYQVSVQLCEDLIPKA